MSVEIKNLAQLQAQQIRGAKEGRGTEGYRDARAIDSSSESGRPESSDQITLTSTARRLSDLNQTVNDQPAVDRDRVAALRQAIQDGSYQVNADKIADRLIALDVTRPTVTG